ncbi:disulfide-isomerase [Dionaea muscipula]
MAIRAFALWTLMMLVAAGGGFLRAEGEEEKEFVLNLDHSNFTDVVSRYDFIVVEFYAPWCGHCQKLAPEYEMAASILSKHEPPIMLAKVDASEETNRELAMEHNINGLPTIKIMRNRGKIAQEYKGPREADGIVDYIKGQLGPASVEIKSVEDAKAHIDLNKIFIVGVFPSFSGDEFDNFTKLAETLRSDYAFGHTLDAKILPRGGGSDVDGSTIRLLKPFDELFVDFKGFDLDEVEKFIEEASVPSLTVYDSDPSNHPYLIKYFNNNDAKAMLFVNFSADNFAAFKSKFQDIAVLFKGNGTSFLIGDLEDGGGVLEYFGIEKDQAPLILIQKTEDQKFMMANLVPDQIVPWFKQYLIGKLKPFKKSQPVPEVNDEPVKVVVADSLNDMVLNSEKNVLLEFYAPWCGHCKQLAPVLDEVALNFEKDPSVMIAKLDATANDFPSDAFKVMGFPTMYFKSSTGRIVQYDGSRAKEAIIEFITKNKDIDADSKIFMPQEESSNLDTPDEHDKINLGHADENPTKDEL